MSKDDEGVDATGDFVDASTAGMVTGYVLFVTFIDAETGEVSYWGDTMEGQSAFTSLGMTEAMSAIERNRIVSHDVGDDDWD